MASGCHPGFCRLSRGYTAGFGALGPVVYGALIGDGKNTTTLFVGYLLGAGVMVLGGVVAAFLGVAAEGKSLEDVATPLSAVGRLTPAYPAGATTKAPIEGRATL